MIFCSKNEDGIPKWKQVLEGNATVTRRLKPIRALTIFAVQPNRCQKAVCHAKVKSCMRHLDWIDTVPITDDVPFLKEAGREGFKSWNGLLAFFEDKRIDIMDTYRIEFEVM